MKIIILEGIATSGKTTVKENLSEYCRSKELNFEVVGEETTLMPILDNTDKDVSLRLLEKVINDALQKKDEVIIFDRLYFTHIFRTNSKLSDFSEIENLLLANNALLIFLSINKELIGERIFRAMEHRDESWSNFVRKKGSDEEIVEYYKNQQEDLLRLLKETKLPSLVFDATENNYDEITKMIIKRLNI